jgi:hypothetical protein
MTKDKTTQQIRDYLGVSYTIAEVEQFIDDLRAKLDRQAPYFNGRDLDKLKYLEKSIDPAFDFSLNHEP